MSSNVVLTDISGNKSQAVIFPPPRSQTWPYLSPKIAANSGLRGLSVIGLGPVARGESLSQKRNPFPLSPDFGR